MQPHWNPFDYAPGSGGKIFFIFPPVGFRFLSPSRKEQCSDIPNVKENFLQAENCSFTNCGFFHVFRKMPIAMNGRICYTSIKTINVSLLITKEE